MENRTQVKSRKILPRLFQRILDQELEQVLPFIIQNVSSCLESADIFHQQFKGQQRASESEIHAGALYQF